MFGRAVEIYDKGKEDALVSLIQKYSGEFMKKGMEYIQKDGIKAKVIKIKIEHLSGKARK